MISSTGAAQRQRLADQIIDLAAAYVQDQPDLSQADGYPRRDAIQMLIEDYNRTYRPAAPQAEPAPQVRQGPRTSFRYARMEPVDD